MLRWRRVEISGGFLLLTALLYYLDEGNVLPWALLACALHELGHFLVIRLLGGRVRLLRLTCVGAEMRLSDGWDMTGWKALLSALAGPLANLIAAFGAARAAGRLGEGFYVFAGLNLALGAFNLLPAARLDGGRVVEQLLIWMGLGRWAGRVVRLLSAALGAALLTGELLLIGQGRLNLTLLLTALWMMVPALPGTEKKREVF